MTAVDRITAIVGEHYEEFDVTYDYVMESRGCHCGHEGVGEDHERHVAERITAAEHLAVIELNDAVTVSYGVVLDDLGSTDYYETVDEAVEDAGDGQVVKVFTVPTEAVSGQ